MAAGSTDFASADRSVARWVLASPDREDSLALASALGCPPSVARLLLTRGFHTLPAARSFLRPSPSDLLDPNSLLGMAAAVERIQRAVRDGEKILIYGDYDVDGTIATVLLKTAIERTANSACPARVTYHVPHRLREGYGIQNNILGLASESGVRLVISVDTGIRAFSAATEARALGLDLIVTDHHIPDGASGIPEATAVINPAQSGCNYANKGLCGAGVAFKLAHALLLAAAETPEQRRRLDEVLIPSFLKLVSLATVADSVPLTGENRAIAWLGLRALRNPVQPGLRALMNVAQIPLDRCPTESEVGFRLAPRINAAGRMDVASDVVELFLTRDPDRAASLAQKLDDLNQARRATEAAALEAIELQLMALRGLTGDYPPECIVLGHPQWHRGVLGILASRVVDRTRRPALILSEEDGHAHGSGRSIAGFHLLDALTSVHDGSLFSRFGGHAHAVGFSLPSSQVAVLRERMRSHSSALLTSELLIPEIQVDVELTPGEITPELFGWLEQCAPFGVGNPEPVFLTRGLVLTGPVRRIKEHHVCIPVTATHHRGAGTLSVNAMGWSRAGAETWLSRCDALKLQPGSIIDAVYRLRQNKHPSFGGIELELLDFAPASTLAAPLPDFAASQKPASL